MQINKGRNKIREPYTMKDFYEFYKNEYGDNRLYMVDKKLFYELVDEFYKRIMDLVLLKAEEFIMPYRLGSIRVIKRKISANSLRPLNIDWATTKKLGKYVYHLNEHSKNYRYLFHWEKRDKLVDNLYYYRLPMSRHNKRRLAKLIKSGEYDYYEKQ